jgi:hypothetical protein
VVRVGAHEVVVGRAHVDRRVVDGSRVASEHGVELGVVVGGEPHVVVAQSGGAAADGE